MSIAVVISLFNHERYIGEALRSVLAQTQPADRIIVIEVASAGVITLRRCQAQLDGVRRRLERGQSFGKARSGNSGGDLTNGGDCSKRGTVESGAVPLDAGGVEQGVGKVKKVANANIPNLAEGEQGR